MSRTQDVIDFHTANPQATARQCAEALGMDSGHVRNVASKKQLRFASGWLSPKNVVKVHRKVKYAGWAPGGTERW